MALPIGTIVRDQDEISYVVEAVLGKGGFGAVYLVREQSARRTLFALKEVVSADKRERDRIIFEGEVLKRLEHRALPRVYRVFDNGYDRTYLLMDYIRGANLEELRLEQPEERVPLAQVLMIMTPVWICPALSKGRLMLLGILRFKLRSIQGHQPFLLKDQYK